MAKIVDPRTLPDRKVDIPGLKPPITQFPTIEGLTDKEVDDFNRMIRELRGHKPKQSQAKK
jgi:hypothetical protein